MFIEFEPIEGGKVMFNVNHITSVHSSKEGVCTVYAVDGNATQIKGQYDKVMDKIKLATYKPMVASRTAEIEL